MTSAASEWSIEPQTNVTGLSGLAGEKSSALELAERLGQLGHWQISLPDYAITWSTEVYRLHGVTPDRYQPTLETAIGFYHPDDRDVVQAAITAAAQDGTSFEFSLRLIRADGMLRYVKARGLSVVGPDQVPALIFGVLMDVTEQQRTESGLQEANLKLEQIAYIDALTRIANRRQFDEVLEREWRRAIREQTTLSLVMIDIDRFKGFNDQYGHVAGDACLRAVAAAAVLVTRRPGDLVARYGGEEFALILPGTEASGAKTVAQAVHSAITALGITHAGNPLAGQVVTASLGVATAYPQPDTIPHPWSGLIAQADAMLYEAKRTGRNKVVSPADIVLTGAAPLPLDEPARLAALAAYEQAGATARTAELDQIARLAATLTSMPIGLVSLVGQDEQRFAGNFGLAGVDGTERDVSFCAYTILGDDPFVVPDATRDPRFAANALVTGDFGFRYYAGAPIISPTTGHRLGAVCVIDKAARETSPAQRALLADLAQMAATLLEEKRTASV